MARADWTGQVQWAIQLSTTTSVLASSSPAVANTLRSQWVTRSLTGRSIRPRLDPFRGWKDGLKDLFRAPIEEQYLARYKQALPIPVCACSLFYLHLPS